MGSPLAQRGDPLGFDLYVGPTPSGDVDATTDLRSCSGLELVRNGMIARCMADTLPKAGAPGGAIAFGKNLRRLVGSAITQADADAIGPEMAMIFARDPRLDAGSIAVTATVQPSGAQWAFTLTVTARTTTRQPIRMVLGVSALTVQLLAEGSGS